MHGNAAHVGGSNILVAGGNINTDGVTVTEVLGPAVVAETPAPAATEAAPGHAVAPTSAWNRWCLRQMTSPLGSRTITIRA